MLTLEVIDREINNIIQHGTNYTDCSRLADLYICKAGISGGLPNVQIAPTPAPEDHRCKSEFIEAACNCPRCWEIVDELMTVLKSVNPRLYAGVLRKMQETEG